MAEINIVKQMKPERQDVGRWFGFDQPLFRGSLFGINPFTLMRRFTEDMDRVFQPEFRTVEGGTDWRPALEVKEKEGKLLITAELPGVKTEDVKVHIEGDALIVEGERKQEKEEKREGYYHSERDYGRFCRSILLPQGANADQTAAHFNNGILEIAIPVDEAKTAAREIPVQDGTKKAA
ncbi:MAG TPA: Hsp20/alpha crystallin family protein [Bryobacteraceae bacterium]|nr:Hsp20/alpha crystallin family protein [Bryobacteraceae bacterium]